MRASAGVPALCLVLLVLGAAPGLADWMGGDAPDSWEDAWAFHEWWVSGRVGGGSDWDWYVIDVPTDQALRVKLEAPVADGRVEIREDDGAVVGTMAPNVGQTVSAETGALRVGVHGAPGYEPFDYFLVVRPVDPGSAVPPPDGSLGHDAGNTLPRAFPLGTGIELAEVGFHVKGKIWANLSDPADWYSVRTLAGSVFDLHFNPHGYQTHLRVTDASGNELWSNDGALPSTHVGLPPAAGPIFIGIQDGPANYTLDISARPAPDLMITDLVIESVPLTGSITPLVTSAISTGVDRVVRVTVANEGGLPSDGPELLVWVEYASGLISRDRTLYDEQVPLFDASEKVVLIPWDTRGEFGDVTVHAQITDPLDPMPGNDRASTASHVVFGNVGVGGALLSPHNGPS